MSNEAFGTVYIVIGGTAYGNFTEMSLKRDKKDMTPQGTIALSWPAAEMFNARNPPAQKLTDGARGEIWLDNQKAATIMIDSRTSKGSPSQFRLDLSFRGLSSTIIDSVPDHPSGQENDKKPGDIVRTLVQGHPSKFIDETGDDSTVPRFIFQDGETIERAIRSATREYGYNVAENEDGNLVMKPGDANEGEGQNLILGHNFIEWSVKRDLAPRYAKVKAKGSKIPTDKAYGKDAEVQAMQASDAWVQDVSGEKIMSFLATGHQNVETLTKRARYEANRRHGKGIEATLTMSTWSDNNGRLWKVGRIHRVVIPVDQVDDNLMIASVEFQLDRDKRHAVVRLVSPEAFNNDKKKDSGKGALMPIRAFTPTIDTAVGS